MCIRDSPTAINLLLVLHCVLNHQILFIRALERLVEGGGEAVESRVLGGLDALVVGGAAVEFASGVFPFA